MERHPYKWSQQYSFVKFPENDIVRMTTTYNPFYHNAREHSNFLSMSSRIARIDQVEVV